MKGSWKKIEEQVTEITNKTVKFIKTEALSGGCINQAWKVLDSNQTAWFIKTNDPQKIDMFAAEFEGLNEIAKSNTILSPKALCYGANDDVSYLVLEYIPLQSRLNQRLAGEQLAKMHQTYSDRFGWYRDNTIGSTVQVNSQYTDWVEFWKTNRLLYQLDLAQSNACPATIYDKGLALAENTHWFFSGYNVKPSLLHGDLWAGNIAADNKGNPLIYDPAVYYGDREADLAMTELFGGFDDEFYSAYQDYYTIDHGYKVRKTLYNLYHILNHYNLFGGGYASQAGQMIDRLLAEVR